MKMESQHLDYYGIHKMISCKSNFTQEQAADSTASTKHKVLATTASIFDPLELLSPAVIVYKIFMQTLWQDKLQWDELLPVHLQQEWTQVRQTILQLSQIKINRKVMFHCNQHPDSWILRQQ
jgi:hypothetical protein